MMSIRKSTHQPFLRKQESKNLFFIPAKAATDNFVILPIHCSRRADGERQSEGALVLQLRRRSQIPKKSGAGIKGGEDRQFIEINRRSTPGDPVPGASCLYDRIIISSILKAFIAFKACDLLAGMMIKSPVFTLKGSPAIVTSLSPSST